MRVIAMFPGYLTFFSKKTIGFTVRLGFCFWNATAVFSRSKLIISKFHTRWCPSSLAKLVNIKLPLNLWFMADITWYNYSFHGGYKPTNITGGHHPAEHLSWFVPSFSRCLPFQIFAHFAQPVFPCSDPRCPACLMVQSLQDGAPKLANSWFITVITI